MKSKIKYFNNEKGFGFLNYEISNDIFVHYSQILSDRYKTLSENEIVEFNIVEAEKGFQAKNVKPIKENIIISSNSYLGALNEQYLMP